MTKGTSGFACGTMERGFAPSSWAKRGVKGTASRYTSSGRIGCSVRGAPSTTTANAVDVCAFVAASPSPTVRMARARSFFSTVDIRKPCTASLPSLMACDANIGGEFPNARIIRTDDLQRRRADTSCKEIRRHRVSP